MCIRDSRQIADLLGNGSHPVALFLQQQALSNAAQQGLPVAPLPSQSDLPSQVSGGFGYVGLMDHAPHPNAAKVFVNWLLSKEGQQLWQNAELEASTRTDLSTANYPTWFANTLPKPGLQYFDGQSWDFVETQTPGVQKSLQQLLGRH